MQTHSVGKIVVVLTALAKVLAIMYVWYKRQNQIQAYKVGFVRQTGYR